uniref:Hes family bHLH transcription factor 2 n=1 Tax=Sphenodon punctatus TaxID=8508 RepID=A0A8D0H539_SPHPU
MSPHSAAPETLRSYRPKLGAPKKVGEATELRKVSARLRSLSFGPPPPLLPCPLSSPSFLAPGLTVRPALFPPQALKPLMEKRRRARINESLNQLKTLILPLIGKDNSRYSKLEKADILEMTVQFLKELPAPCAPVPGKLSYREGYRACLSRLTNLLDKFNLLERDSSSHLMEHLNRSGMDMVAPLNPSRGAQEAPSPPPQVAPSCLWRPW